MSDWHEQHARIRANRQRIDSERRERSERYKHLRELHVVFDGIEVSDRVLAGELGIEGQDDPVSDRDGNVLGWRFRMDAESLASVLAERVCRLRRLVDVLTKHGWTTHVRTAPENVATVATLAVLDGASDAVLGELLGESQPGGGDPWHSLRLHVIDGAFPSEAATRPFPPSIDTTPAGDAIPTWDRDSMTLRYGGQPVRVFKRFAGSAFPILDAFQECGWPVRIDSPFRDCDGDKLRDAVRSINRGLAVLLFERDGTGEGVRWRVAGNSHGSPPYPPC